MTYLKKYVEQSYLVSKTSQLLGKLLSKKRTTTKPGTIRLMQNIDSWRSDQFQPTHVWNPWSNKTDANLEDTACTVRVLLDFSGYFSC